MPLPDSLPANLRDRLGLRPDATVEDLFAAALAAGLTREVIATLPWSEIRAHFSPHVSGPACRDPDLARDLLARPECGIFFVASLLIALGAPQLARTPEEDLLAYAVPLRRFALEIVRDINAGRWGWPEHDLVDGGAPLRQLAARFDEAGGPWPLDRQIVNPAIAAADSSARARSGGIVFEGQPVHASDFLEYIRLRRPNPHLPRAHRLSHAERFARALLPRSFFGEKN